MDSNYDGIQISYGSNNRITGNTITNNNVGIHVYHSEDYFISNNIFSGNSKNTEGIPSVVNPISPTMIALVVVVTVSIIIIIVIILIYKKKSSRRVEYKYKEEKP